MLKKNLIERSLKNGIFDISHLGINPIDNFPIGNFPNVQFHKRQLFKG